MGVRLGILRREGAVTKDGVSVTGRRVKKKRVRSKVVVEAPQKSKDNGQTYYGRLHAEGVSC